MNPFGLILIILGILLIIMGIKGSQSGVLAAIKGVKQGQSSKYTQGAQATVNGILAGAGSP